MRSRSLIILAAAAALSAAAVLNTGVLLVRPAAAHHGWGTFDTKIAFYVRGSVAKVRWGNPHSEVVLLLEPAAMPEGWLQRPLPQGGNERDGRLTMESARPYAGNRKELELVLAGPDWMARWGLHRPLRVGEKIEAVGFLNVGVGDHLRPVMFWLEDGQGVWQQLTAFPQQPEATPKP